MKYIPLLTICILIFLPTPAQGFLLIVFIYGKFFTPQRTARDCAVVLPTTGIENAAELCTCGNSYSNRELDIACAPLQGRICLSPSDARFCSNATASDNTYRASTTSRYALRFSTSPKIEVERVDIEMNVDDFRNRFVFTFWSDGGLPSPKAYNRCAIRTMSSYSGEDNGNNVRCNSCEICDNGVDFKYDCSNSNGTLAYNPMTKKTKLIPSPKIESCIPVADIIPSF